ncbi:MAG: DUF5702 domain-containing protein [Lachnospiraceae bacterium]|nr:DUF5702 domain-containing protein [Lachnospiraceae bacterium]
MNCNLAGKLQRRDRAEAVITVFLSLILAVLLSLIGAVISSIRYSVARARTEMVMNMGLMSIFAEYNRELLDQYDLYFIDTSYGSGKPSIAAATEHLKDYMAFNCSPSKNLMLFNVSDMAGLSVDDAHIDLWSYATDQGGRVFKRQAIHSIKDRYGLSIIDGLKENLEEYNNSGISEEDVDKKRAEIEAELSGEDMSLGGNPVQSVFDKRPGILNLILNSGMECSDKELKLDGLTSYRDNQSGIGVVRPDEDPDSFVNELLFNEYLSWKMSCYTDKKKDGPCSYELEYILSGENTDRANLRGAVKAILIMREAADTIAVLNDKGKKAQANTLGFVISLLLLSPDLAEAIGTMILLAWGFAEAVMDVRALLSGERVPLLKGEDNWQLTSIGDLFFFLSKKPKKCDKGLSYKDYLKLQLALKNSTDKVSRALDVIEMNLRETEGNGGFRMDGCVDYMQAEAALVSSYGFEFTIRREFAYEEIVQ